MSLRPLLRLPALLFLVTLSSGPVLRGVAADGPGPLPRSTPESQGVSSAGVLAFLEAVEAARRAPGARVELHSFMLVRHGAVVAEGWWDPYRPERPHMLFSLSKSFASTAVGLAAREGYFDLDDRVVDHFAAELPETVSPQLAALRVRDLLTMSTGQVDVPQLFPRDTNWIRAFLAYPFTHEPGTHFYYNTMATYMAAALVQRTTGSSLTEFLGPRLFEPLGITGAEWEVSPEGLESGGVGLNVRTEDIAKFALLYLQEGSWNGRSLLPADWVREATAARVASASGASSQDQARNDWAQGYGYQFWRTTHDAYRADGAYGQFALVLPAHDAVVAITGGSDDMQAVLDLVWEHLLPAFHEERLPENPAAAQRLEEALGGLSLLPPEGVTSSMAVRVSGRTYHFEENDLGVRTASFDFSADSCTLRLETAEGARELHCGIGRWVEGTNTLPDPAPGMLLRPTRFAATAAGSWTDENTFTMTVQMHETPFKDTVTARFEGDALHLDLARGVGGVRFGKEDRPVLSGRLAP